MNFDPSQHNYTTPPTFTGKHCAICGRPESEHAAAKLAEPRELSKPTKAGELNK